MIVAERLNQIRKSKKLSQGDIEKRTGLLHCYISRVENGHMIPAIEAGEKMARTMEIPMYQFYDGDEKPPVLKLADSEIGWGTKGKDAKTLDRFRRLLRRTSPADQNEFVTQSDNHHAECYVTGLSDSTIFEERVIQECDRWLKGEPDAEVTEPTDFYLALKLIKAAIIQAKTSYTVQGAIAEYSRYVGLVPADQRTRYDARWQASRKDSSSWTPVQPFNLNRT
jgi:transcriptional regulator with XRE-family HTH domain